MPLSFSQPAFLLLFLLLIPYILWYLLQKKRHDASMTVSTTIDMERLPRTMRVRLQGLPFILRIVALSLLILVLARPQTSYSLNERETEGIDIMLTMDISASMSYSDVRPNRITAAKEVACEFINGRPNDNIGLILFGGEAFTKCPLTTDHATLTSLLATASCQLQQDGIIAPGTAIGMGLALATSHLSDSKTKSKVVILLTDGANNTGEIQPLMAADIAREKGVRVYTILLGGEGEVEVPVAMLPNGEVYTTKVAAAADSAPLKQIAEQTGGVFYKADSKDMLKAVYKDIDKLEKTKLRTLHHSGHYEAYQPFLIAALLCLLIEFILHQTYLRRLP